MSKCSDQIDSREQLLDLPGHLMCQGIVWSMTKVMALVSVTRHVKKTSASLLEICTGRCLNCPREETHNDAE